MTEEDEEFERMLAKTDLQHTPSKDSQLVSLRRWEIDEMIRLAVLAEREECAKMCDDRVTAYQYATDPWAREHIDEAKHLAETIRAKGQK